MLHAQIRLDMTRLQDLAQRQMKNILKKAMRRGTKDIIKDVKSKVPVRSGALKTSISSKVDARKEDQVVYALVGPRSKYIKNIKGKVKKPSRYAHFVEHGKFKRPFLIPAWESGKSKYLEVVQQTIAAEVEAVLTK